MLDSISLQVVIYQHVGKRGVEFKGGSLHDGLAVLTVLAVLESTLPLLQIQHNEATVAVSAVSAVSIMTATLGRREKTPTPKTRVSSWTLLRTPGRFTTRPLPVYFTTKMSVVRPLSVLSKDEIGRSKTGRFLSKAEILGVGVFSPLSIPPLNSTPPDPEPLVLTSASLMNKRGTAGFCHHALLKPGGAAARAPFRFLRGPDANTPTCL